MPYVTETSALPTFRSLTANLAFFPCRTVCASSGSRASPSCRPSTSLPHATLSLMGAAGFAGSFTSNSTVPVASFGWLWIMPLNAILYFPGATQIVVVLINVSRSALARSSDSTYTAGVFRVIVSPGLTAPFIGIGKPPKGGGV